MAISQLQIQQRAFRIANMAGIEPHGSAVVDNFVIAEDLFVTALREAVRSNPKSSKRVYSLTVASGESALPDTVLEEHLFDSYAYLAADTNLLISFEPRWIDFVRTQFSYPQLAYYTVRGNKFCYRGPNQVIGTASGSVSLVTAGMPDVPATITDDLGIGAELADLTIIKLAEMIRGAK